MRRCPDIRKAELQLGFEPKIGLDEGVNRFLPGRSHAIRWN